MAREKTVQGKVGKLQRLLARLNGNRPELQHMEPSLVRFEGLFGQIQAAADRQALHTAGKQEASQDLRNFLAEAERLATILQLAVKQHYGIRAEKLADFGLQPFRGRKRKASAKPAPEPTAPEPSAPKPTTPPTPATDRT
jgi:hypothetical protein